MRGRAAATTSTPAAAYPALSRLGRRFALRVAIALSALVPIARVDDAPMSRMGNPRRMSLRRPVPPIAACDTPRRSAARRATPGGPPSRRALCVCSPIRCQVRACSESVGARGARGRRLLRGREVASRPANIGVERRGLRTATVDALLVDKCVHASLTDALPFRETYGRFCGPVVPMRVRPTSAGLARGTSGVRVSPGMKRGMPALARCRGRCLHRGGCGAARHPGPSHGYRSRRFTSSRARLP
jgi:hypothetical protein